MLTCLFHEIISFVSYPFIRSFEQSLKKPREYQLKLLHQIGYERVDSFREDNDFTTYHDYRDFHCEDGRKGFEEQHQVKKWELTSGSTQKCKWIPYTKSFLGQLEWASMPWLNNLYRLHPEIKKGQHYWALSWIPPEHRESKTNDDKEYFSPVKKWLLKFILLSPTHVATSESLEASMKATISCWLTSKVSLISVWSPSFLISHLKMILEHRDEFIALCREHRLMSKAKALGQSDLTPPQLFEHLFPHLKLVSCWGSSSSSIFLQELKKMMGHCNYQEKGLWSTEGVVTIPFNGKYPVAVKSHYYEFLDEKGQCKNLWELEKGDVVEPILTTGSGLKRYRTFDQCMVTDFYHATPCLTFLGRLRTVDLVGEKIDESVAVTILNKLNQAFEGHFISLIAKKEESKGHYLVLGNFAQQEQESIGQRLEELLSESYHYKQARLLKQLGRATALFAQSPSQRYYELTGELEQKLLGEIKIKPLIRCDHV